MTWLRAADLLPMLALWPIFLAFLRCGAAAMVMPGFGERSVPARVRLVAAFALAWPVAAYEPSLQTVPVTVAMLIWVLMTETLIGLLLGMMLRLVLIAMQTAGAMAAQATSLAQLAGGAFPDPLPGIGQLLSFAALALLMLTGFAEKAVVFLALSYQLFPVAQFPMAETMAAWGTERVAHSFSLAFQLAAPFVLLSMLYNITLGAINRAMPQLMVAMVGAPVITGGSLIILLLAAPDLLRTWLSHADAFVANPAGVP